MKIIVEGDPILREIIPKIEKIEKRHFELAQEMAESLEGLNALGLSANQIGLKERMFVAILKEGKNHVIRVFFNPEIAKLSEKKSTYEEGCLSIPEVFEEIDRPESCTLRYVDVDGNTVEEEFDEMNSRVIQHETDHLNGVLFTDYLDK